MTYWHVYLKGKWHELSSPYFFDEGEACRWASSSNSHVFDTITITRYQRS